MRQIHAAAALLVISLAPFARAQSPAGQALSQSQAAPATQADQMTSAAEAVVPPDQQATREQLTKLFEAMRLRKQFDSMTKTMPAIVERQVHEEMAQMTAATTGGKQLSPQQQTALDKLTAKYLQKATSLYPAEEMFEDAMAIYQRHMSRSDADAYIAFYSSPPGQHLLDAQPVIMTEYMPVVTGKVQARTRELYAEMAQDIHEFTNSQEPQAAPAPAPK
ncbi:MAG TPA: DUF2059 domain-containing protein [Bryobacteraceae bacterium]|nr:DUF2059 domain-containing protein [Bryobacteraceae bacterium]